MRNDEKLWEGLKRKQELMDKLGLGDDLTVVKDIALCILANPGIMLENIIRMPYFKALSRSTIKRTVVSLIDRGYLDTERSPIDKRSNQITWRYAK